MTPAQRAAHSGVCGRVRAVWLQHAATPLQHPCNTPAAADDLGGQVQAARDARAAKAPDHLTLTPEHPNT